VYFNFVNLLIILYNDVPQLFLFFCLTGSRSFAIVVEYWYTGRSLALILNILSNWVGNHFYPYHYQGPLSQWVKLVHICLI
jgi:hypothetical protein